MWNSSYGEWKQGEEVFLLSCRKELKEYNLPQRERVLRGAKEKLPLFGLQIGTLHLHSKFVKCMGRAV